MISSPADCSPPRSGFVAGSGSLFKELAESQELDWVHHSIFLANIRTESTLFHPQRLATNVDNYRAITNGSLGGVNWVDYMRGIASRRMLGPKPPPSYPGQRFAAAHTLDIFAGGCGRRFVGDQQFSVSVLQNRFQWWFKDCVRRAVMAMAPSSVQCMPEPLKR